MLGHGAHATLSVDGTRLLVASPEAWRSLGWHVLDDNGYWETFPAETFGPLPSHAAAAATCPG